MRYVNPKFNLSQIERADLVKAWLLTSVAFAIYFIRTGWVSTGGVTLQGFGVLIILAALTAGIGFIVHELSHKYAAFRYGVHGEFRANTSMLFMSIFLAVMGILIAAPGAVHIFGRISRKENGVISAAGPASNVVMALLFLPLAMYGSGLLAVAGQLGLLINAILGAFNLIPFGIFDGAKILDWSKPVYFTMLVVAALVVFLAYSI